MRRRPVIQAHTLARRCRFLPRNGLAVAVATCPLLGDELTWLGAGPRSENDPTETSAAPNCIALDVGSYVRMVYRSRDRRESCGERDAANCRYAKWSLPSGFAVKVPMSSLPRASSGQQIIEAGGNHVSFWT